MMMNLDEIYSSEMEKFFEKRTNNHINLVKKYTQKIADKYEDLAGVVEQASNHDSSKYENPEYEPYLHITWQYKCKDDGADYKIPEGIDGNAATLHHIKNNRHHPEFHDHSSRKQLLNRDDRDAVPDEMVDATGMDDIDIAEMVADWCAMSEERGNTPSGWADMNINKRWKFDDRQRHLIYGIINNVWED